VNHTKEVREAFGEFGITVIPSASFGFNVKNGFPPTSHDNPRRSKNCFRANPCTWTLSQATQGVSTHQIPKVWKSDESNKSNESDEQAAERCEGNSERKRRSDWASKPMFVNTNPVFLTPHPNPVFVNTNFSKGGSVHGVY
jgi:hypothetical protein